MKAINSSVVIHVSDLNRALSYYKDTLGFVEDFRVHEYVGLTLDNVCIHLSGPGNQGKKKAPGSSHFCIECEEVDKYFNTISSKGAFIDVPLDDRFYGMRDFAVNDHDGNTLVFGEVIDEQSK